MLAESVTGPVQETTIPTSIWILLGSRVLDSAAAAGLVTIIGKQVFDMTGNELSLGLLGLAEFLPTAVLAPFSGSIADRFDRRLIGAAGSTPGSGRSSDSGCAPALPCPRAPRSPGSGSCRG